MELLIWHVGLGTDDEQATEQELLARLLYAHTEDRETAKDERNCGQASSRFVLALQFMQALVAFTRMVRMQKLIPPSTPRLSVVLMKRRFVIEEVEPHIFMALGIPTRDNHTASVRSVHQTALRDLYEMFRMVFDSVDNQLRHIPSESAGRFSDGMEILERIGLIRKRLRKISIELELYEPEGESSVVGKATVSSLKQEAEQLESELLELEATSPSQAFRARCEEFFPTMLRTTDTINVSMFHGLDSTSRFPLERTALYGVQSQVNTLQLELDGVLERRGVSVFCNGSIVWSTMDEPLLVRIVKLLQLREQDGMDTPTAKISMGSSVWMGAKYEDPFSPIWSSKTTYAERVVVNRIVSHPRRADRSIHKFSPSSLGSLVADAIGSGTHKSAVTDEVLLRRGRYNEDTPVYRNRGFLTADGYFLPSWELLKRGHTDQLWSPMLFIQQGCKCRLVVYHERGITALLLVRSTSEILRQIEKISDVFERIDLIESISKLLDKAPSTVSTSGKAGSVPPSIQLNRHTGDLTVVNVPRLIKKSEEDPFPRPASVLAHYIPLKTLSVLNNAYEAMHSDPEFREARIKTGRSGWVVARNSWAQATELYALLDTKVSSLTDVDDALAQIV